MQYICYTIQTGDSLQGIATAYGVNINDILAANPELLTQAVICPGVTINLPQQVVTPPSYCPYPTPTPIPMPQPTPIPTPTPQPNPGTGNGTGNGGGSWTSSMEDQVVELVNSERTRRGLDPLAVNQNLAGVARIKSDDMASNNYFSHNSPTYGSPFDMLRYYGITYSTAGENIASGQTTAESVMNTWMNSAGHAANILNDSYTEIGVGYSYNNGRPIWTQMFIRP